MTRDRSAAIEANRKNWDQRAPVHAASKEYDLEGFIADPERISTVTQDDLAILLPHLPSGTVSGLDVVHLQCHIGTDTLSLARLGARVTGVDFSSESLKVARNLATRTGLNATFVESEVSRAQEVIEQNFDVVYTSIGTIAWLPYPLVAWARTIDALLRPGGTFFIRDGHPILLSIDENKSDGLVLKYPYFPTGEPLVWDEPGTYTDGDHSGITDIRTYDWPHPISEIITVLLDVGMQLIHFGEHQDLPWQALPQMTEKNDRFHLPDHQRGLLPLAFSLVARKPE